MQRLQELHADEQGRTKKQREKREQKRLDKEMARLEAQYVLHAVSCF